MAAADAGPRLIVGHVTDRSVRLWVRAADSRRPVAFVAATTPGRADVRGRLRLRPGHDFTGVAVLSGLAPDTEYRCEVEFRDSGSAPPTGSRVPPDHRGRFRTFPARPGRRLDFLFGSCIAPRRRQSPDATFRRLATLARGRGAAFMIHCGDQIYYPARTAPALDRYRRRYKESWSSAAAKRLLAALPHYMLLDDHELTNNFRNDKRPTAGPIEEFRELGLRAYREYQHSHNPQSFGRNLYYRFDYADIRFFAIDVRSERNASRRRMVGPTQLRRFRNWLLAHRDDLKLVVTPVPFVVDVLRPRPGHDKWSGDPYRGQREALLDFIGSNAIRPPVFLTGDMHNSYHATMTLKRGYRSLVLHELMASPLSQVSGHRGSIGRFLMDRKVTLPNGWSYRTTFSRGAGGQLHHYREASNVMHVQVDGDRVRFRVYPTRRGNVGPAQRGSFPRP